MAARIVHLLIFVAGLLDALPTVALAQWGSSANANLTIADGIINQVQPKIRPTSDGGAYVAWLSNDTGLGYNVYLQRLNAAGVEQWPTDLEVAPRNITDLTLLDVSLAVDSLDNAVLAFVDDRMTNHITVQKVDPTGALLWNESNGINVGAAAITTSQPHVTVLSDNDVVVVWSNTASPVGTTIQKLDANGSPVGSSFVQNDPSATPRSFLASDVEAGGTDGSFIVLFVRCTGANCTTSNKRLSIQKYKSDTETPFNLIPQWNGATPEVRVPIELMTANSIPTSVFPQFLPDGNGGAILGWYTTANDGNAYLQHVLSDGQLKFPAPISNVDPSPATRDRTSASVAYKYNSETEEYEYYVASTETDSSNQENTVFVQHFNNAGERTWGSRGVQVLSPTTTVQPSRVQAQIMDSGVVLFWLQATASNRVLAASKVLADQTVAWKQLLSCDPAVDRPNLDSAMSTLGFGMVAFQSGLSGAMNIQAQNVHPNGALGTPLLGDMNCNGVIDAQDASLLAIAILDTAAYVAAHPCCNVAHADVNSDGVIDSQDIQAFVDLLP